MSLHDAGLPGNVRVSYSPGPLVSPAADVTPSRGVLFVGHFPQDNGLGLELFPTEGKKHLGTIIDRLDHKDGAASGWICTIRNDSCLCLYPEH
jgi:hypothetical protein